MFRDEILPGLSTVAGLAGERELSVVSHLVNTRLAPPYQDIFLSSLELSDTKVYEP